MPERPSWVVMFCWLGWASTEKSEHGQAAVENAHCFGVVIAIPSVDFAPVVIVAVKPEPPASSALGVRLAVLVFAS